MQLIERDSQQVLLSNIEVASTIWKRFRGLMLRRQFDESYGLWLEPCRSVHTMWMRVSIDVFFIDQNGTIVEHHPSVRPWSFVKPGQPCHCVLEVPHSIKGLAVGSRVCLRDSNSEEGRK